MGVDWGAMSEKSRQRKASYMWANSFGRPSLYRCGPAERVGACFVEPSDMFVTRPADALWTRPWLEAIVGSRNRGPVGRRGTHHLQQRLRTSADTAAVGLDPGPQQFRRRVRSTGHMRLWAAVRPTTVPAAANQRLSWPASTWSSSTPSSPTNTRQGHRGLEMPHHRRGAALLSWLPDADRTAGSHDRNRRR